MLGRMIVGQILNNTSTKPAPKRKPKSVGVRVFWLVMISIGVVVWLIVGITSRHVTETHQNGAPVAAVSCAQLDPSLQAAYAAGVTGDATAAVPAGLPQPVPSSAVIAEVYAATVPAAGTDSSIPLTRDAAQFQQDSAATLSGAWAGDIVRMEADCGIGG